MRKITSNLLGAVLLLSSTMTFLGCSTIDDGSYTAPITLTEKIGGKWVVNSVTQTDETNTGLDCIAQLVQLISGPTLSIYWQTLSTHFPYNSCLSIVNY